jgi:hypothetical protein
MSSETSLFSHERLDRREPLQRRFSLARST